MQHREPTRDAEVTDIGPDRVEVIPAPGEPAAKLPFWKGDTLGRSIATGQRIGRFVREMGALEPEAATVALTSDYHLEELAARCDLVITGSGD